MLSDFGQEAEQNKEGKQALLTDGSSRLWRGGSLQASVPGEETEQSPEFCWVEEKEEKVQERWGDWIWRVECRAGRLNQGSSGKLQTAPPESLASIQRTEKNIRSELSELTQDWE